MQPEPPFRTATRLLLTFAFGLLLAFVCLFLVFLAGLMITLLVLIPGLLLLIYLLPGHGEAP